MLHLLIRPADHPKRRDAGGHVSKACRVVEEGDLGAGALEGSDKITRKSWYGTCSGRKRAGP
jgi:hypothetical protein